MRKAKIVIACMAVLAVLLAVKSAAAQGNLQGVWKLTKVTFTGPNARTITPTEPGIWIFVKKHVSMTAVMGDKPRPDLPRENATDAQKVATWTPFVANASTYEIKGKTVTVHPLIGKNPIEPGSFTSIDFKIEGNTLSLTPKANKAGPIADPYTLTLVRLE